MKTEHLRTNERILLESRGTNIKGKFSSRIGRFFLTNERLLFVEQSIMWTAMFGLIGMFIASKIKRKPKVELEISNIASVERTKYGFNKNVIILKTNSGEEFKFGIDKNIEEWINRLQKSPSPVAKI